MATANQTTPAGTGLSRSDLFGADFLDDSHLAERALHRAECGAEQGFLDGTVDNLMQWFGEGSPECDELRKIVARAAEEKAALDVEAATFDFSPF